ncbi:MAG: PQQ-dependent sugar dehydrogenase [Pirellulales bacterium]|nr:PQQ-dependent sugar dehydrogenase [Pirellulales bacterium]
MLRPWLKLVLATLGTLNVVIGVGMIGFYHEGCKLLHVPKPHPLWILQLAGAVTLLLGIGYWLVSRHPYRFRRVLPLGFGIHVAASLRIVWAVSHAELKRGFLLVVLATALCYLVPLTIAIRQMFMLPVANDHRCGEKSTDSSRRLGRLAWRLMLAAILLPSSWAMAYAVNDFSTRYELRHRPSKWVPLAVHLPETVGEEYPYAMVDAYPHLRFLDPTYVIEIPDHSGRLIVLERRGRVQAFAKDSQPDDKTVLFADLTDRVLNVPEKAEDGLLCLAFHPEYATPQSPHRGEIFVRYTSMAGGSRSNRLSRFKATSDGSRLDPDSEEILIQMPERTAVHKGGAVAFGPDGFLYTTFGTDGRHFPHEHAQRINHGLWGGVLRIDPDCRGGDTSHPPVKTPTVGKTAGYFIPNENPFVGQPDALEEFYSLGFRNPWRMSVDQKTGLVWVGDVGDRRREEIDLATPGSNHQFDYMEGTLVTCDYEPKAPLKPATIIGKETPPLYEYERDSIKRAVIGGYVYRGKKFPELVGKYIYSDLCGRVCAITVDENQKLVDHQTIAVVRDPGHGVSSLGQDADGELYVVWIYDLYLGGGRIYRFERGVERHEQKLPTTLSATGLFTDMKSLTPNPALIEFDVNTPLWSDRAKKQRWIGLASQEKIGGQINGNWQFPAGAVFVKHFDLPLVEGEHREAVHGTSQSDGAGRHAEFDPSLRRLETRIIVCGAEGTFYGAAYRWNREETEAYLVTFAETEDIEYVDAHGEKRTQTWLYPGRFDCLACHNQVAGAALGFNARQLNRDIDSRGLKENQLVKFAQAGMFKFDCRPDDPSSIVTLKALDDSTASVESRVRSYLDSNCSYCHQPGNRYGQWDGRYSTPLDYQKIVDGVAFNHRGDNPRSRVIRPGDLDFSFLFVRLSSADRFMRMPPVARSVVHEEAVKLFAEWIKSLPPLPEDANPSAFKAAPINYDELD